MLKQIKTLGLVVVIGSMLVGCDKIDEAQELLSDTLESTQDRIKVTLNKEERDKVVLETLMIIVEENGNYEEQFLEYYRETGNDFDKFVEDKFIELVNSTLETINNNPEYDYLNITEDEVCTVVTTHLGSNLSDIDKENLIMKMYDIDILREAEENSGNENTKDDKIASLCNTAYNEFITAYEIEHNRLDGTLSYHDPYADESSVVDNGGYYTINICNGDDEIIGTVNISKGGIVTDVTILE